MAEIDSLRSAMTDQQCQLVNATWSYFRAHSQWPPARLIHQQFGGKPKVRASLEKLGGTVVFEYEEGGVKQYRLSLLGVLLSKDGIAYEQLLVRFLTYVSQLCASDPLRTHVSSAETASALALDGTNTDILGYLIRESHFSGSGRFSAQEWNVEICEEIEDFPDDLRAFVREDVVKDYDAAAPVAAAERSSYRSRKRSAASTWPPTVILPAEEPALNYIDQTRLSQLQALKSDRFDLTRLVGLCSELNICYSNGCYLAVAMLTRALIDHIPPLFGAKTFSEVATSDAGSRSFRDSMSHLDLSCRKIADSHLHVQIRNKEVLPNKTQVNFANDLDVLLAEVVRLLS